jgi:hypothetical protein
LQKADIEKKKPEWPGFKTTSARGANVYLCAT